ncbi:NnrS family protein [Marinicaulis aureus]|uniref:NnrS family protein n=1 Tax=Hyphococcus aureus TaxID=2666033 RepID=A0ABW1L0E1_9PROT
MLRSFKSLFSRSAPRDLLNARRGYDGPALFSYGFRPFFLFGAIWAALSVPLWIYAYANGAGLIGGMPAQEWHVHEMLYGYLAAVISGFLLTAVPNWTGRLPVLGGRLMFLFALWGAGRIAMLAPGQIGPVATASTDCLFLVVLAAMIWREIIAGKNIKNVPVCVLVTLLALSNIGFHAGALNYEVHEFSEHFAIGVIALMVALIGGRIVPSFTRNWLNQQKISPLPAQFGVIDKAALGFAGLALIGWTIDAGNPVTGVLLLVAGVTHMVRLARWRGWKTGAEPLVLILHVGYAWLPLSFLLMGVSAFAPAIVPPHAALHGLTAGAMGTMTLAVMTRATLGHTGRKLTADAWTIAIYGLVVAGALLRIVGPTMLGRFHIEAMLLSALVWSGAFILFALRYGPMLFGPKK